MKKYLILSILSAVFGTALWFGYAEISSRSRNDDFSPVSITGVQHLGRGYMISEFYVDKYGGDTVGREGGGGSILCCAMLPVKWRPGLTVEIRWGVEDWTHANDAEIAKGNYESVSDARLYIAKVPVEKYDEPYDLIVHFFPRGRVRVVGDKTTHGGTVIAAQPALKALGKAVAVDGDLTMCPQCKGNFPIQVASSDRHHHGKALAYDGDKAACGAKLISSI